MSAHVLNPFRIRIFERVYYDVTIEAESQEAAVDAVRLAISGESEPDLDMVEVDSSGFELDTQ